MVHICGGIPEWPNGPDCKSGGSAFAGSNPASPNRRILKSASCLFSDVDSFRTARPCEKTVLTEILY